MEECGACALGTRVQAVVVRVTLGSSSQMGGTLVLLGTPSGRRQAASPPCLLALIHLIAVLEGQVETVRHKVVSE